MEKERLVPSVAVPSLSEESGVWREVSDGRRDRDRGGNLLRPKSTAGGASAWGRAGALRQPEGGGVLFFFVM